MRKGCRLGGMDARCVVGGGGSALFPAPVRFVVDCNGGGAASDRVRVGGARGSR